ncbi:MAG: leucine-rich repeat domain-containing protein, partial [Prosthecobacter sp.]|nr:leucine-rich repeat domain-containing protein [Prosthecobacter sp.]
MPLPPMTPEAQDAYEKALERIEACRRQGRLGTGLNLSNLGLTLVPPEIGQLSALKELRLFSNQLTGLPSEIGQLSTLTVLDLEDNQLTSLPPEIGQLSALTGLSLSNNHLTNLPPEIGLLAALTELSLDSNQLTSLPPEIGQLSALKQLDLYTNQLTSLPPEIGQLSALTVLNLSENPLTSLPLEIVQLYALTVLWLHNIQLTSLPPEIVQLSALTKLSLSDNRLTILPSEIGDLKRLEFLILEGNALGGLPESLKGLTLLKMLTLHGNETLGLPVEVLGPTWANSGVKNPPADPQAILDYYFRARVAGGPLNEVKVILVGRGGAGKTSLVKRLVKNVFDEHEKETPGICITDWSLRCGSDEMKLHLWDFAGQEITHGTHQFFFSQRSVYLLLLTGREGNAERDADYWLRLIRAFGSESPVLVVLNKIEQSPFELDEPAIQRDHPSVRSFHPFDCKSGHGRTELLAALKKTIQGMDSVHKTFPAEWMKVKNRLSGMTENYLDQKQYRSICAENGEKDSAAQDSLAGHLHHLGIALNYADDPRVRHALVLNPGWVTDGIYKLIRG